MKKNWLNLAFVVTGTLVFHSNAHADQRGNGGGGVVCRNDRGKITSVTTLDVYEAKFRGMQLDFGKPSKNPLDVVNYLLDRLAKMDPQAAENYRKIANRFFDEKLSRFKKGINLDFTEDTGLLAIPVDCKMEQIVLQQNPEVPEDRLFTVNQDLFEHLDVFNQAAMILHEVIYNELISMKNRNGERVHPTSFYARYFNEKLIATTFKTMSAEEYIASFADTHGRWERPFRQCILKERMHSVNWRGVIIDLCSAYLTRVEGEVPKFKLTLGDVLKHSSGSIHGFNFSSKNELEKLSVYENSNGTISIHIESSSDVNMTGKNISVIGQMGSPSVTGLCEKGSFKIDLFPSGAIKSMTAETLCGLNAAKIRLFLNNAVTLSNENKWNLIFNENGNLIQINSNYLTANAPFTFVDGSTMASSGALTLFPPNGGYSYRPEGLKDLRFSQGFGIISAEVESPQGVEVKVLSKNDAPVYLTGTLSFYRRYSSASIKSGTLVNASELLCGDGNWRIFGAGTFLLFDENARVIK